jgi:hypothetical protein
VLISFCIPPFEPWFQELVEGYRRLKGDTPPRKLVITDQLANYSAYSIGIFSLRRQTIIQRRQTGGRTHYPVIRHAWTTYSVSFDRTQLIEPNRVRGLEGAIGAKW